MTQTAVAPAPPTLSHRVGRLTEAVRHELARTPGQLRVAAGLAVLATLIVALGGGAALRERSLALDEARDAAQHLVLVQGVQTQLAQANADATNSFLGFGLEPVQQRLDYIDQVQRASRDLAEAARTNESDARTLGMANTNVTEYVQYVASARANNRQGLPVGANYLNVARSKLEGAISDLNAVAKEDSDALDAALARAGNARWWLALVALLGVGGLLGVQLWLARRSRRIVNAPLAVATGIAVVALLLGGGAMAFAQSRANDVTDGSLRTARDLSTSRVAAFQAKAQESFTLIQRGSATEADFLWTTDRDTAARALPRGSAALEPLNTYSSLHRKINALDFAGRWDDAVKQATSLDKNSANAAFAQYAETTGTDLTGARDKAVDGLDSAGILLFPMGLLIVLAGLVAAVAAWWGVSLRLDEYR
jgi:hypothetical protein